MSARDKHQLATCAVRAGINADTQHGAVTPPIHLSSTFNFEGFDQKRRFGIDFLWPIDRYVAGLSSPTVADRYGNVVTNPLLANRDPSRVVFTAIVGVPWQDIARRKNGVPDLREGVDASGRERGGFQNAIELAQNGTWDVILGDHGIFEFNLNGAPYDNNPATLDRVRTIDTSRGGSDTISGNAAADVVKGLVFGISNTAATPPSTAAWLPLSRSSLCSPPGSRK